MDSHGVKQLGKGGAFISVLTRPLIALAVLSIVGAANVSVNDAWAADAKSAADWLNEMKIKYQGKAFTEEAVAKVTYLSIPAKQAVTISNEDLENLAVMTKLTSLDLTYAVQVDDAGMEVIGTLTNLESFNPPRTITDQGFAQVKNLTALRILKLNRTHITDKGMVHLAGLKGLTHLSLVDVAITDAGLAHIARLPALTDLQLRSVYGVTDAGMKHVAAIPLLKTLRLYRVNVDRGVRELAKAERLETLQLDQVGLGDANGSRLGRIPNLKELIIYRVPVGDATFNGLSRAKHLAVLSFQNTAVTDKAVAATVGKLANLTRLNLSYNWIGDKGVKSLEGHKNLRDLNLSATAVSDASMAVIATIPTLESVSLTNTRVSDTGIDALTGLAKLRSLNLGGSFATPAGANILMDKLPNKKAKVHVN